MRARADILHSAILEKSIMYSDDAYLTRAMMPIYAGLRKIKGSGAPARRIDLLERAVGKMGGVWNKMHDAIEKSFGEMCKDYERAVVLHLGAVFDGIHAKFNSMCEETKVKTEEEKLMEAELRKALAQNLAKVSEMVKEGGRICKLAEQCKKDHASGQGAAASQLLR